jgi:hypothetical protein
MRIGLWFNAQEEENMDRLDNYGTYRKIEDRQPICQRE